MHVYGFTAGSCQTRPCSPPLETLPEAEDERGSAFRQSSGFCRGPLTLYNSLHPLDPLKSMMNPENPPPYPGPGPTAPYPPYPQPAMGPTGGPYPPPQGYPYQGYPQYGWQGGPQEPPKTTVYVVEDQRRDDLGPSTCLTACWTALCCCCLWDMLT
ncbi:cysteine-rich and transmembrane domain-containing protein 1 isoform X2 [Fukomys damarensis]|uniref:cysteine-rich and transmembrane domain-containing protein 1 isoform X2 n=1 Tax=Fukomys damarensis TaxID=885580 RepID=UPI00053F574F|nr:cysteine-rich and transmembrane domain-containing protein 1 isoform X2 [Fukomys damarensis]